MNRIPLALFALLALALPAAAGAEVVPQKSIAGVSVADTEAEVREELGKPARVKTVTGDFGPSRRYTYAKTEVGFLRGAKGDYVVFSISTVSRSEKTSEGIGVGSTEAAVKKGVSRVKCETIARLRSCHVGSFTPGRIVTDFFIEAGKVVRVSLARVVD